MPPLNRPRADTAIRSFNPVTLHHQMTRASDVEQAVLKDLRHNTQVTDTDAFLSKILPVSESNIDVLFDKLKGDGAYKDGKWADFPNAARPLEKEFYGPFVGAANAVTEACRSLAYAPVNDAQPVDGAWIVKGDTKLETRDTDAASIRPDIVYASKSAKHKEWDNIINDLARQLSEAEETETSLKAGDGPKIQPTTSRTLRSTTTAGELEEMKRQRQLAKNQQNMVKLEKSQSLTKRKIQAQKLWWLQIHIVLEVKRGVALNDWTSAVKQVFGYMRQVLREQLDRRFVIGLVLCSDQLTVWLCDRSGVIGTAQPINIHEEPKKFIQVISAFSLLDAHRLGWDPSMQLYIPRLNLFVPSYNHDFDIDNYQQDIYKTHWAIEMPGKSKNDERERFITIRALSAVGAEVMCGRATIVWEVIKYDELSDPRHVFALKSFWHPYRPGTSLATSPPVPDSTPASNPPDPVTPSFGRSEGELYELANSDRIYSYEDVKINGIVDSTLESIRGGLEITGTHDWDASTRATLKRPRTEQEESYQYLSLFSSNDNTWEIAIRGSAEPPVSRAHVRVLMTVWGWPVKFFKSRLELLTVVRDAVTDHRDWYHNAGILHRDVSIGNVLICPTVRKDGQLETTCNGRLIDLDHAKISRVYKTPAHISPKSVRDLTIESMLLQLKDDFGTNVEREVVSVALKRTPKVAYAVIYISKAVSASSGHPEGHIYSCEDLFWNLEAKRRPTFDDHEARDGFRTGTLPFMSSEVLAKDITYSFHDRPNKPAFLHDAAHDLESFLWVVVYLCTTRSGPGGVRRKELQPDSDAKTDPTASRLCLTLYKLFEGPENDLQRYKADLLAEPDTFTTEISPCFHEYFKELVPMVEEWWKLLHVAYTFRAYEYEHIHHRVLAILEKAIKVVEKLPTDPATAIATATEEERREKDYRRILNTFRDVPGTQLGSPSGATSWNSNVSPTPQNNRSAPQAPSSPTPAPKKLRQGGRG